MLTSTMEVEDPAYVRLQLACIIYKNNGIRIYLFRWTASVFNLDDDTFTPNMISFLNLL